MGIHNTWLGSRVGVDEEAVFISVISRPFQIPVPKRGLNSFQGRYHPAVPLQFSFSFLVGSFNGGPDFFHRLDVRLGDDQTDAVFGRSPIDGFGFPHIGITPAGIHSGDHFARIHIILSHSYFLLHFL